MLMDKNSANEWRIVMERESEKIAQTVASKKSDINPYALENPAEFFSVVSEYFFENPKEMKNKHPELYSVLQKIYKQDTFTRLKSATKSLFRPTKKIGRNSPCPCGSGKKYKYCCGA